MQTMMKLTVSSLCMTLVPLYRVNMWMSQKTVFEIVTGSSELFNLMGKLTSKSSNTTLYQ